MFIFVHAWVRGPACPCYDGLWYRFATLAFLEHTSVPTILLPKSIALHRIAQNTFFLAIYGLHQRVMKN